MPNVLAAVFDFALIIPAIILHEVAHGFVAYLLGDPTAKDRGRLTLNPISHMDIWGTVVMPVVLLVMSGGEFAFGYAKPVPINPYRMTKTTPETGMLLTGAAGPATNIVLALVTAGLYRVMLLAGGVPDMVISSLAFFVRINLVLAFFNLIPIPPLDGSRVVQRFLSGRAREMYASIEPYGFMIVILIAFVVPSMTGRLIDPLSTYLNATVVPIERLLGVM
jgi:Zn-dependent protease